MSDSEPSSLLAGRYVVERQLGAGGMGVVVRARDVRLGRTVAIKLLHATSTADPSARERLVQEARAAALLSHPGIVRVYDVGETDDGTTYVVMELVDGVDPRAERRPWTEQVRIAADVARALAVAHAAGVVHRDIKPDNIRLVEGDRAVILDFGLAKPIARAVGELDPTLTSTGVVLGTPAYLAPEQARAEEVDGRADQFALAVTLCELVSGRLPWTGASTIEVMAAILRDAPVLPGSSVPDVPEELDAILGRALSKKPADRYPDMDAFADALEALPGVPKPAERSASRPLRPLPAATQSGTTSPGVGLHTTVVAAAAPRWRGPVVVAAAFLLLVGGAAAVWSSSPRSNPLGAPASILACPVLASAGVEEPAGWLGAAAAHLVCERATWLLGGRVERTLVPAELLGLPAHPATRFPADPYVAADARQKTLRAARASSSAYFDGKVTRDREGFSLSLVLRSARGTVVGRAWGRARVLEGAVDDAMHALVDARVLPVVPKIDPRVAAWTGTSDPDRVADLDRLFRSLEEEAPSEAPCRRLARKRGPPSAWWTGVRAVCAHWLADGSEPGPLPALDRSTSGALATSARLRMGLDRAEDAGALADEVHARLAREKSALGRAHLAALESDLRRRTGDLDAARALALVAVRAQPRLWRAWTATALTSIDAPGGKSAVRAFTAWQPGWTLPWALAGKGHDAADVSTRLMHLRRAFLLAPDSTIAAMNLAGALLEAGEHEEVRSIAADLAVRDEDARVVGELLAMRLEAGEARFAAALARGRRAFATTRTFGGGSGDFQLLYVLREIAEILGRSSEVADEFIARFVDRAEPRLSRRGSIIPTTVATTCALASPGPSLRCFEKLRGLVSAGYFLAAKPIDAPFIAGAERWARGDWAGAAAEFRPVVGSGTLLLVRMSVLLAPAFDRAGDPELAARVDAPLLARPGEYRGVNLATVRAALRADHLGDRARARALAAQVVDAWSVADAPIPVLEEMRRLRGDPARPRVR